MQQHNGWDVSRRSSRVPIAVPLLVTSMDPGNDFSEVCETVVVNAHGCALRSPMKVKAGVPVHLHTKEGREMMARIVDCQPIGSTPQAWKLGAQLDQPDNFWGLNPCPDDWAGQREPRPKHREQSLPKNEILDQLSAGQLQDMVAPLLQPLQAEVAALREKLSRREANPSRFEVSLSQIPPQLEQELWARLRQDLGQRTLELTREEAQRIFDATQTAMERQINLAQDELRQHACDELSSVAQRLQAAAEETSENVQQHFSLALQRFQQNASDSESHFVGQQKSLAQSLQQQLTEAHDAQRRDLERFRQTVTQEWSRIESQLAEVDSRLAKLDDSARRLESEFDTHISGMASELVAHTKVQLESAADAILRQLRSRNAQALGAELDQACSRMKAVREEIEASASQSLQARISQNTLAFEQTLNQLAQQYVESWRRALANQLTSFVSLLGQNLRVDPPSPAE